MEKTNTTELKQPPGKSETLE